LASKGKIRSQTDRGMPEKTGGARKKEKAQRQTPFYILSDDDMDRIGFLIRDSTEALWEEAATKHEDHQKKVQDQLGVLQQLLETTCIVKDPKTGDDPSTTQRTVEASAQEALIQPSGEHHTIQLEEVVGVTSGGIAGTTCGLRPT
jgi:hypothetical protein